MVAEDNDTILGRKYHAHLRKTRPDHNIRQHRKCAAEKIAQARIAEEVAHIKAEAAKEHDKEVKREGEEAKESRHIMSLVDRQNQIYDMAMLGAKLALYKTDPTTKRNELRKDLDLRGLAGCLAQANAIVRLMHECEGVAKLQEKIDAIAEAMAKNE